MKFTWENCPHCRKTLNFKSEGGAGTVDSPIGQSGSFRCPHCGGFISNGKQEWVNLDFLDKAVHVLRMIWTMLFWGFGFGLGGAFITDYLFGEPALGGAIGAVGLWAMMGYSVWQEIQDSKRRSRAVSEGRM